MIQDSGTENDIQVEGGLKGESMPNLGDVERY